MLSDGNSRASVPRVFLDTSVIAAAVRGQQPHETPAISWLLGEHLRGSLQLLVSTKVRDELQRIPKEEHRQPQLELYQRLHALPTSNVTWIETSPSGSQVAADPTWRALENVVSGTTDRMLLVDAQRHKAAYFATTDARTILSKQTAIESSTSFRVGTPTVVAGWLGRPSSST